MLSEEQAAAILSRELSFQTSRSGGKGGQNVNKVETKVELSFDIAASQVLTDDQKQRLLEKYPDTGEGAFIKVTSDRSRSQLENKEDAGTKLIDLISKLLKPQKKRVPTRPSKASRRKKLDDKKRNSEKKSLRQKLK